MIKLFKKITPEQKKAAYQIIKQRCIFRYILMFTVLALMEYYSTVPAIITYLIFSNYFILNTSLLNCISNCKLPYAMRHVDVLLDSIIGAYVIYATGGALSRLSVAYFFGILFLSVFNSYKGTIIATIGAVISYTVGSFFHDPLFYLHQESLMALISFSAFAVIFAFFNTAFLKQKIRQDLRYKKLKEEYENISSQSNKTRSFSPVKFEAEEFFNNSFEPVANYAKIKK